MSAQPVYPLFGGCMNVDTRLVLGDENSLSPALRVQMLCSVLWFLLLGSTDPMLPALQHVVLAHMANLPPEFFLAIPFMAHVLVRRGFAASPVNLQKPRLAFEHIINAAQPGRTAGEIICAVQELMKHQVIIEGLLHDAYRHCFFLFRFIESLSPPALPPPIISLVSMRPMAIQEAEVSIMDQGRVNTIPQLSPQIPCGSGGSRTPHTLEDACTLLFSQPQPQNLDSSVDQLSNGLDEFGFADLQTPHGSPLRVSFINQ